MADPRLDELLDGIEQQLECFFETDDELRNRGEMARMCSVVERLCEAVKSKNPVSIYGWADRVYDQARCLKLSGDAGDRRDDMDELLARAHGLREYIDTAYGDKLDADPTEPCKSCEQLTAKLKEARSQLDAARKDAKSAKTALEATERRAESAEKKLVGFEKKSAKQPDPPKEDPTSN